MRLPQSTGVRRSELADGGLFLLAETRFTKQSSIILCASGRRESRFERRAAPGYDPIQQTGLAFRQIYELCGERVSPVRFEVKTGDFILNDQTCPAGVWHECWDTRGHRFNRRQTETLR